MNCCENGRCNGCDQSVKNCACDAHPHSEELVILAIWHNNRDISENIDVYVDFECGCWTTNNRNADEPTIIAYTCRMEHETA